MAGAPSPGPDAKPLTRLAPKKRKFQGSNSVASP